MNRILTSNISDSAGLPILGRTLDFVQDSFVNQDLSLLYGQINKENTTDLLFIYGGVISLGAGTISITKGMVQYGNELYQVDAQTYTYTTLSNVGLNFSDTWQSGEPTTYTDSVTRNTNRVRKLSFSESPLGGINYLSFKYLNRIDTQSVTTSGNICSSITVTNASSISVQIKAIKKGNITILQGFMNVTSNSTTPFLISFNLQNNYMYKDYIYGSFSNVDNVGSTSDCGQIFTDSGVLNFGRYSPTISTRTYQITFNVSYENLNIG